MMPVITLEAGKLDTDQKRQLVKDLIDTASKVMQVPVHAFIVLLKENIGFGGGFLSDKHS